MLEMQRTTYSVVARAQCPSSCQIFDEHGSQVDRALAFGAQDRRRMIGGEHCRARAMPQGLAPGGIDGQTTTQQVFRLPGLQSRRLPTEIPPERKKNSRQTPL
jgi:hypothetical protein